MDLSKAFIIGVDFKNQQTRPLWEQRVFAEIVLIDKTHSSLAPLLYQIKETAIPLHEHLPYLKKGIPSPTRDAFILLGDVDLIDKRKKEIHLNSKNIVAYNYLIIATGNRPTVYGATQEEEFTAGLQALLDAIRVKNKVPAAWVSQVMNTTKLTQLFRSDTPHLTPNKEIEKIAHPFLNLDFHATIDLTSINRRLYQLQV